MQSFYKYIDRLGLAKAQWKCDQEPSTFDVRHALVRRFRWPFQDLRTTNDGPLSSFLVMENGQE